MRTIETPVLVVGGGGAGLSAAAFLADLGVDCLLVERHSSTSHLPKAHYINQRSMEVFRQHGMAEQIYARACPRENMGQTIWRTPLGGDGPLDRKVIKTLDSLGSGGLTGVYDLHGSAPPANICQLYLEPVLRQIAEERNPGRVLFRNELVSFSQDENGVDAIVRDLSDSSEYAVRCQYLIAADAGKTVGPVIGVNMIGPTRGMGRVAIHFAADLSAYIEQDTSAMHCIVNPNGATAGSLLWTYLLAFGPDQWGRHSREWGISLAFSADEDFNKDPEYLADRIRAFLQIATPIKILNVSWWFQEAVVASKFAEGRIFLVGDAAHKHAPPGGLGLNSGVQDVHNLCWKVAAVLRGHASPRLLNSYEPERRPVVTRNAEHSMLYLSSFALLVGATGLVDGAPPEFNRQQLAALLSDTADGAARRRRMDQVFEIAKSESGQDLDIGFVYDSDAVIGDGTSQVERDPAGVIYRPSTRPGCRLPHVWLRHEGKRLSTHDLVPMGGFLLLTGAEGAAWRAATQKISAESGVPLRSFAIGGEQCDAVDPSSSWREISGIESDGAILVRPDGHVAFRVRNAASDATRMLKSVLARIHVLA